MPPGAPTPLPSRWLARLDLLFSGLSLLAALFSLIYLPHVLAERWWEPAWMRQTPPIAAALAWLFGLAVIAGWPHVRPWPRYIAAIACLLALIATAQLAFSPRGYVDGEPAWRVKCASNLRQIGQAMLLYSNEHAGAYPDSLATVAATEDISAKTFICPVSGQSPSRAKTAPALAHDLRRSTQHRSYLYLAAGLAAPIPPDVVLACEPLEAHKGDGMNILLGDGRIEWITAKQAQPIFAQIHARQHPIHYPPATQPTTQENEMTMKDGDVGLRHPPSSILSLPTPPSPPAPRIGSHAPPSPAP